MASTAAITAYQLAGFRHPFRLAALRRGLLAFESGQAYDGDLEPYLRAYSRNGSFDTSPYSARFWIRGQHSKIYNDTYYAILLRFEKSEIARIGIELTDGETMTFRQIQGRKDSDECEKFAQNALAPLRWEKMLLEMAGDWAKRHRFTRIGVQPARNNTYWKDTQPERNARLYLKYDVTARRSGFRFDEDSQAYVRDL